MTDQEFHNDLVQSVVARAAATSDFTESAFADFVGEALADSGAIPDFEPCVYRHRGTRIDGYCFADDEATLDLFVVEYRGGSTVESLTRTALDQCVRRVESFADQGFEERFTDEIDVAHPAWGLARQMNSQATGISRVRVNVLTDAKLSSTVREVPPRTRAGREWLVRVWDLQAISRLMTKGEPEEIVIDFSEMFGDSLACLPANSGSAEVSSYLTVVRGDWLAEIYGRYSGRLLEQNVRTFLQVKGGVNKGIRRTILEEPHMFFAYNNGISATAAEAEFVPHGDVMLLNRVRHLQIVNGGQTTASIFNVLKKDRAKNLGDIRVQMKLSVVRPDLVETVVPRISEYANSQNKVSAADFFSNHPFHVRVEGISRRLWAPAPAGSQVQTHWFYERARGQYLNAGAYLTPARKREFELNNPRRQVLQKTDLAKVIMTFRCLPHVVSFGAQKNFARFAEHVADAWKEDGVSFGDDWFREAIAMTIVFRTLEKMVQDAPWYAQGYRANIVTYSIALLQTALKSDGKALDLQRIWQRQQMSEELGRVLMEVAERVQVRIVKAASEYGISNVTEWCKKEKCWEDVQAHVPVVLPDMLDQDLISNDEVQGARRSARREQRVTSGVEAQTAVIGLGSPYWQRLLRWALEGIVMTPTEVDLLRVAATPRSVPSPAQSQRLLQIRTKAVDEGFGEH